jgi:EmrB/QacA subfamily drug resistance transporter
MPYDAPIHPRRGLVLAACMMATFTAAIESTIVATAMPTIVAELNGAELYSWVFSAYLLTQAVTIPIYGRLADLYGRKPVFVIGAALFFAGSALCGFAGNVTTLILFRAVQGCGAGAVQPIAYTIVGDIYTPVERARIQGMLSGVFGCAAIAGPTLGAILVEAGSWRFVFWINLPIVAAAIAMVIAFLRQDHEIRGHKIDVMGAILLVTGICSIVLGADRWRQLGAANVLVCCGIGLIALAALIFHERRTPEPMLPGDIWNSRIVVVGGLRAFAVGAAIMSVLAFMPSYIQAAMGRTSGTAGIVLAVMMVVWMFASITAGRLMVHITYRTTACIGAIGIMAGAALLIGLAPDSSIVQAAIAVSILGIGLGFCNTTWIVSVQTQASYQQRGSATSSVLFMRFLGQALGAACAGVILSFGLRYQVPEVADPVGKLLSVHSTDLPMGRDRADLALAVSYAFRGIFIMTWAMGLAILGLASQLPRGIGAGTSKQTGR